MNHTDLSKKEQGRIRYMKRQTRIDDENARRTRPSDISPRRITDGIKADHKARARSIAEIFPKIEPKKKHHYPATENK